MFPLYSNLNTIDFSTAGRLAHIFRTVLLLKTTLWYAKYAVADYRKTKPSAQVVLPPLLPFSVEETLKID